MSASKKTPKIENQPGTRDEKRSAEERKSEKLLKLRSGLKAGPNERCAG